MATSRILNTNSIPRKLRTRGLTDLHRFPLAADPKDDQGQLFPRRMDPVRAWQHAYIEINPANAVAVIVVDCDDLDGVFWGWEQLPARPTYRVHNRINDHMQMGWVLRAPVHLNPQASRKALVKSMHVATGLTRTLNGDPSFSLGTLVRNPVFKHEDLHTYWCDARRKGFTLDELSLDYSDNSENVLARPVGIGRNVSLFDSVMEYAGSPKHQDSDLQTIADAYNNQFNPPLPQSEVNGLVRSVERYRAEWITQGKYYDHSSAAQSVRGLKSGKARQKQTIQRDAEIVARLIQGQSQREVAKAVGVKLTTVQLLINNRDRVENLRGEFMKRKHGVNKWDFIRFIRDRFET